MVADVGLPTIKIEVELQSHLLEVVFQIREFRQAHPVELAEPVEYGSKEHLKQLAPTKKLTEESQTQVFVDELAIISVGQTQLPLLVELLQEKVKPARHPQAELLVGFTIPVP